MNRTDRVLLAIALLLLLMTLGSYFGLDRGFFAHDDEDVREAVAQLIRGQGDVRVKFNDQFQWEKGRINQKLTYDDAIFSGANSSVDVRVGQSELKLDSNTLVILRQERTIKSLNLSRGMITGLIAKNEQIRIETGDGERIDLAAVEASKIVIERKGTKTSVKVTSGNATLKKDGREQTLTSRDQMAFVDRSPAKMDPLRFITPDRQRFYTRQSVHPVEFAWEYTSQRAVRDNDEFILEFSQEPTFKNILMRENLLGQSRLGTSLPLPQSAYYRVRDGQSNFSPVRRLILDRPEIPRLMAPRPAQEFRVEPGDSAAVIVMVGQLQPGAQLQVQIARDREFVRPEVDVELTVPQLQQKFPSGDYWLRARSRFNLDKVDSDWTVPIAFAVRENVNPLDLKRADLRTHIVIPNLDYPASMYEAPVESVQAYLATAAPFPNFFNELRFENHRLVAQRRDRDARSVTIEGGQFPATWIDPGLTEILYRLEGARKYPPKMHRMVIEMEAPKRLQASLKGEARWSPILFARSYEGRLIAAGGEETAFQSARSRAQLRVELGRTYTWKVRALGRRGEPISRWSTPHSFTTPAPPPTVISEPVVAVTKLERKPASEPVAEESRTRAKADKEKPSIWQRIGGWLWSGSGFNYVNVTQTISNTARVEYENTKGPSAYVEAGYISRSRLGGVVSYKRTPGDVRVDNYPINKRDFIWTTTSAEGLWVLPWQMTFWRFPLLWTLRAGLQNHYFPFLYVDSGNALVQGTNHMLTGSAGFQTETVGSALKYYWSMRYQQPISSGSEGGNTFTVTPTVAFDGSVGASYNFTERWKTGLFWYGQLHAYDFNYQSATQSNSGKQSLFYSNMELRVGIDW